MRTVPVLSLFIVVATLACRAPTAVTLPAAPSPRAAPSPAPNLLGSIATATPPIALVRPVTDTYYGVSVTDPYRWMEAPDSPELQTFLHAEEEYTRAALERISGRAALRKRISELNAAGDTLRDVQRAGRWIFGLRRPSDADSAHLVVRDGLAGPERVLVDPDARATPGTHYALDWFAPSQDGTLVAFGISAGGSEDSVLHVVETATGKELGEAIARAQLAGVAWLPDGKSFFYTRLQPMRAGAPPTDRYLRARVYLHHIGADPDSEAPLVGAGVGPIAFADSDLPILVTDPSSRWALAIAYRGARPEIGLYVTPLASATHLGGKWARVAEVEDGVGQFALSGDDVFLLSHQGAPRRKLLKVRAQSPDLSHATVVLAQGSAVLTQVAAAADGVYVTEREGSVERLVRLPLDGKGPPGSVALPFEGALDQLSTSTKAPGAFVREEGWLRSPVWLFTDAAGTASDTGLLAKASVDTSSYSSLEVQAPSADGTMVPLSIVARKDLSRDGTHPTLLFGYGAYGLPLSPSFIKIRLAWLEQGGVLAFAHTRGGGELGEEWHHAGRLENKQRTIDDFLACARWLIAQHYTDPAHLAGMGGSAGGITVGNALVQAPELWAAMLIVVGDTNTLRAEFGTDGAANSAEYGSVQTEAGFRALYAVDAFEHVKDGVSYPAVLLSGGANDPRVPVWQPAKMAARLQAATGGKAPIVLRVDFDAGHGIGASRTQEEELFADQLSFLLWQMGVAGFTPGVPNGAKDGGDQ